MLVLLLDASIRGPLLALADTCSGQILQVEIRQNPQDAAALLPVLLSNLLKREKISWEQVDAVIVGKGPGSFTGIKIAMSFVYGLLRGRPGLRVYSSSALGSLGRFGQLGIDLWLLPATSSQGYFASPNQVGTINVQQGFQTEPKVAEPIKNIGVLGEWLRLDTLAEIQKIPVKNFVPVSLGRDVLMSMLSDFTAQSQQFESKLPSPLFLRKSAPEEKADLERLALPRS